MIVRWRTLGRSAIVYELRTKSPVLTLAVVLPVQSARNYNEDVTKPLWRSGQRCLQEDI